MDESDNTSTAGGSTFIADELGMAGKLVEMPDLQGPCVGLSRLDQKKRFMKLEREALFCFKSSQLVNKKKTKILNALVSEASHSVP